MKAKSERTVVQGSDSALGKSLSRMEWLKLEPRYDFGRNWAELAAGFDEQHIAEACKDLSRLVGSLEGKTFLDFGCGSGLHAVAACRLGAKFVEALDYDPQCVATARAVLERFASSARWRVGRVDALDRDSLPKAQYDIVYSWGVLHHTGDLDAAIRNVASLVNPSGLFCLALYVRTPFCGLWRVEKRVYSRHRWLRTLIKIPFLATVLFARTLRHGDPISYVRNYRKRRGMEFLVDIDDWLGGYPYQSIRPEELEATADHLGFKICARFNTKSGLGILGTGCGEWRLARKEQLERGRAQS